MFTTKQLTKAMNQLTSMLDAGMISYETYQRALADLAPHFKAADLADAKAAGGL